MYFIHDEIGYNYRMLNLQAALGTSQIDQLECFIETTSTYLFLKNRLLWKNSFIFIQDSLRCEA